MKPPVLFVDDERNVLDAFRRQLRREFDVHTAESGAEGLQLIEEKGPFSVVVSDMRMPGMDGSAFVARVRSVAPDTVRMILSGQSDLDAAIAAVNDGHIFRFLTKPCPTERLIEAIRAGLEMHRLIHAERELLEDTLSGAVAVLTEVLSVVNPAAFSKTSRMQQYADGMAKVLELDKAWEIRIASMLSQIGCVTLPHETLSRLEAGRRLDEGEREMWSAHPGVAAELLTKIPRLETVARMVGGQLASPDLAALPQEVADWPRDRLGSEILRTADEFDRLRVSGRPASEALQEMESGKHPFHPQLIAALRQAAFLGERVETRVLEVADLSPRMLLDEDVMTQTGVCIVPKGLEITATLLARLRNFASGVGVVEPLRVRVPH